MITILSELDNIPKTFFLHQEGLKNNRWLKHKSYDNIVDRFTFSLCQLFVELFIECKIYVVWT